MLAPLCFLGINKCSLHISSFMPVRLSSQYIKIIQKKPKIAAVDPEPQSSPLSPEQLDKIARNKKAALEKLASGLTPQGFSESWRRELWSEFSKPYFKDVREPRVCMHCGFCCSAALLIVSYACHSWQSLFLTRGSAVLCTHLPNRSSPGPRCVTSETWVGRTNIWPRGQTESTGGRSGSLPLNSLFFTKKRCGGGRFVLKISSQIWSAYLKIADLKLFNTLYI